MKQYEVIISEESEKDLEGIFTYIAFELFETILCSIL